MDRGHIATVGIVCGVVGIFFAIAGFKAVALSLATVMMVSITLVFFNSI